MPKLRKVIVSSFLASIAISLSLAVAVVFLFSKIYLANKVQSLVRDISRETGYEVRIGDISFGLLTGLKGTNVEIFESTDLSVYRIKIGELIIRPDIATSIAGGRLEIEEIVANGVDLSLPRFGLEKLKTPGAKSSQEGWGSEAWRFFSVPIERIKINMGEIGFSDGVKLYISKLDFRLGDDSLKDKRKIDLEGTMTYLSSEIFISGLIEASPNETEGKLDIDIPHPEMGILSNFQADHGNSALKVDLNFRLAEALSSTGTITLDSGYEASGAKPLQSAKLRYDLAYDKTSDKLLVNAFDVQLGESLLAEFKGSIDRLTKDVFFKINGSASATRLGDVITLFPRFSHASASGKLQAKDLRVAGSLAKRRVTVSGKALLIGVDFSDGRGDLQVTQLAGSLGFKKVISRGAASGLSIRGFLGSKIIATKIGRLEDVKAELEYKTDSGWKSSELSFSLSDVKLKARLEDTVEIKSFKTTEPIILGINNPLDYRSGAGRYKSERNTISLINSGLAFEKASFSGYTVEKGSIDDCKILYTSESGFHIDINGSGWGLRDRDGRIFVEGIRFGLSSQYPGESGFKGSVSLNNGRYVSFKFPSATSDYAFKNGKIDLVNLRAVIGGTGQFRAEQTTIRLGNERDRFSGRIEFSESSFNLPRFEIESAGMRGELRFYPGSNAKTDWDGNVFISSLKVRSQRAEKISMQLASSSDVVRVYDLRGSAFGGRLAGSLFLNTGKADSLISSSLILEDADVSHRSNAFFLKRMEVAFSGELGRGLIPQGEGELKIEGCGIRHNGKVLSFGSGVKFQTIDETLLLKEGFIENADGQRLGFTGRFENLLSEESALNIHSSRIPLRVIKNLLHEFLPEWVRPGEFGGEVEMDLSYDHRLQENGSWSGQLSFSDFSFSGAVSGIPIIVTGGRGVFEFDEHGESENILASLLREHHAFDKELFERFLSLSRDNTSYAREDFFTIDQIRYGFLNLDDIHCSLKIAGMALRLSRCTSELFDGAIYLAGSLDYGVRKHRYDLSVLLNDISLGEISSEVNSIKDYISGRVNGLLWLAGDLEESEKIDGLFEFWSIKSTKESRSLGKALLEKLGAKSRFFIGSSRRYDRGEVSGYIKDGVLTFSEFDISNSILGYRNLSIRVDPRRNTISLKHLFSVIRAISKRSAGGKLQIDLENQGN